MVSSTTNGPVMMAGSAFISAWNVKPSNTEKSVALGQQTSSSGTQHSLIETRPTQREKNKHEEAKISIIIICLSDRKKRDVVIKCLSTNKQTY